MEKLTWKDLENYIQTLSEEEKIKSVIVLDFDSDVISEITDIRVLQEKTFGCYGQILEATDFDTVEDLEEAEEDSYIILSVGTLALIAT